MIPFIFLEDRTRGRPMVKKVRFINCSRCGDAIARELIIASDTDGTPLCSRCWIAARKERQANEVINKYDLEKRRIIK